jgi:nucleoside-diphosphate-sugar epimerase
MDFIVAQKAQKSNSHYVMISTRKVYGISDELRSYNETSEINPVDRYSENKFITEEKVRNELEYYTILRGSNIFGNEYGRKTFMGFCLTQLKDTNRIIFTLSGNIKRDFIHIDDVSVALRQVCNIRRTGTYNLSSNYPMPISEIPKFLITGYGMGSFHDEGPIVDQFVLDNYSLVRNFNLIIRKDYRYVIKAIGERLCMI